jgi:putative membrane protein
MDISKFLNSDEINQIENAIGLAEKKTSGEIVPMIVKRSSFSNHLDIQVTLLLFIFVLIEMTYGGFPFVAASPWKYVIFVAAFLICWLIGKLIARMNWIQRSLLSFHDVRTQVHQRALLEFYQSNINHTDAQTGILIFISLLEQQVVVLADKGISAKLGQETWDDMVKSIIAKIKEGKPAEGLITGIEKCGEILGKHFPIQANDINEIPNKLIIKE